jgi:hypothetical protein
MAEQLLHGYDVGTLAEQPRRKGMAQRVPRPAFESRLLSEKGAKPAACSEQHRASR